MRSHSAHPAEPWGSAMANPVCHAVSYFPCHGRGHPSPLWLRRPLVLLSQVFSLQIHVACPLLEDHSAWQPGVYSALGVTY